MVGGVLRKIAGALATGAGQLVRGVASVGSAVAQRAGGSAPAKLAA